MKNEKILIRINNLKDIEKYQKESINNFLFPLKDFSIGYSSFSISCLKKVKGNVYLLINRILDTQDLQKFKEIIPDLFCIKGVFFEDLGIYELLRCTDIDLVWNQAHFVTNSQSINIWLSLVNSAMLSNELSLNEIKFILKNANKKLVLPVLGKNMIMYSRRSLLTNFSKEMKIKTFDKAFLKPNSDNTFLALEDDNGTVLFNNEYYNLKQYIDEEIDKKVLFYYIDLGNFNEVIDYLKGKSIIPDNKFLFHETIYKVGGIK